MAWTHRVQGVPVLDASDAPAVVSAMPAATVYPSDHAVADDGALCDARECVQRLHGAVVTWFDVCDDLIGDERPVLDIYATIAATPDAGARLGELEFEGEVSAELRECLGTSTDDIDLGAVEEPFEHVVRIHIGGPPGTLLAGDPDAAASLARLHALRAEREAAGEELGDLVEIDLRGAVPPSRRGPGPGEIAD